MIPTRLRVVHWRTGHRSKPWVACLALLASGCAAAPVLPLLQDGSRWIEGFPHRAVHPESVRAGFERSRTGGGALEPGDRVLFELTFERGGDVDTSYLAFEVIGPKTDEDGTQRLQSFNGQYSRPLPDQTQESVVLNLLSPTHRVAIEQFDGDGNETRHSEVTLAEAIAKGQMDSCLAHVAMAADDSTPPDKEQIKTILVGIQSLMSLVSLAHDDDLLADLLWDVIDKPSILSVVTSLGVKLNVTPKNHESIAIPQPLANTQIPGPFRCFPTTIMVNGEPALYLDLVVARPEPPWNMTSGIIAFRARHPTRDVRVVARMVGGRS